MEKLTDFATLAYIKAEELEETLALHSKKLQALEILYGTAPPPPDPNDTEDTPYAPPPAGTTITTGMQTVVPAYFESRVSNTFPTLYFTCLPDTTISIKTTMAVQILQNTNTNLLLQLFLNGALLDSFTLPAPLIGTYHIPFANFFNASTVGHKLFVRITPSTNNTMTYRLLTTQFQINGTNADILNPHSDYSVYYNNDIYYITKCQQNYSNFLIQNTGAVNLNAAYTQHRQHVVKQNFCHGFERIDNVWQTTILGYIHKNGLGQTFLTNYNEPNKQIVFGTTHGIDFLPNLITTLGGIAVYTNELGNLHYFDITKDFSSRATRTIESGGDFYVNVAGVKNVCDSYGTHPKKAMFVATRLNGTNVFFSGVSGSYYKLELGYGANAAACFRHADGNIIDVYLRVYDQIVKKVLTLNPSTNRYELGDQIAIGTWQKFLPGHPPAYFTIANDTLSYTKPQAE